MYCENCGRELQEGEICICRQSQKKMRKKNSVPIGEKKVKVNVKTLISFIFFGIGVALFIFFHSGAMTFMDQLPVPGLMNIKNYIYCALPTIFFIAGVIIGMIAVKKKIFKKGSCLAIIGNTVGIVCMTCLIAWRGYQDFEISNMIKGELTAETREKIMAVYNGADDDVPIKEKIAKRLQDEVSAIKDDFNGEKITYEEANTRLSDIESLEILQDEINSAKEGMEGLKISKEKYNEAAQLETNDKTLLQAVDLYAEVLESDNNYAEATKRAAEIMNRISQMIEKGISKDNISVMEEFYKNGNEEIKEKIEEKVLEYAETIKEDYLEKNNSYEDAEEQLAALETFEGVKDGVQSVMINMETINESQDAYAQALKLEKESTSILEAVAYYEKVVEDDPNYEDAQKRIFTLNEQVESMIQDGINEENIEDMLVLYENADVPRKEELEKKAVEYAERIKEALDSSNIDYEKATADMETVKAFSGAADGIKDIQAEIDLLYQSQMSFMEAKKLEDNPASILQAIASYEKVIEEDSNYGEAQNRIYALNKEIESMVQEDISDENVDVLMALYKSADATLKSELNQKAINYAESIKDSFNSGSIDYEKANEDLEKLQDFTGVLTEVASIQDKVDQLQRSHETFEKAVNLEKNSETLFEAIQMYQDVVEDDTNFETAQKRISDLLIDMIENYKTDAAKFAKENNYKEAIETIDACLELAPENEELPTLRKQYEEEYAKFVKKEAKRLIQEKKYTDAKTILGTAYAATNDEELNEELQKIDEYKPVSLTQMHIMDGHDYEVRTEVTDSYGNLHSDVMQLDAYYDGCLLYQLDGQYSKFSGNVVSPEDSTTSDAMMSFAIFADDELIYSASNITRQQSAKEIELDLTNVQQLMIQTSGTDYHGSMLCITEGKFEKNLDVQEPHKLYNRLFENVVIDSVNAEYRDTLMTDAYGNFHNGSLKMDAYYGSYILYNLNQQYTNLSGKIVAGNDTNVNPTIIVQIYLDDELVYTSPQICRTTEEIKFSIDVTGKKVLKISATGGDDYNNINCYVVDDKLYFESTEKLKQEEVETMAGTASVINEAAIHRYEYYIFNGTWEEAFFACISRGGHLVRFNSEEEYDYVLNEINTDKFRKYQFYIGGRRDLDKQEYYWAENTNDLSGQMLNSSDAWCNSCWMQGEPSFWDDNLNVDEHVMNMFYYDAEGRWVWNDVPNNLTEAVPSYQGSVGYICEYDE